MKKISTLLLFSFLAILISHVSVYAMDLPPTPSDEERARLIQLGEENLRKYGAEPDPYKLTPKVPTPTLTIVVPTETPSMTPIPTILPPVSNTQDDTPKNSLTTIFNSIANKFRSLWQRLSRFSDIDSCLDSGSSWDYDANACK